MYVNWADNKVKCVNCAIFIDPAWTWSAFSILPYNGSARAGDSVAKSTDLIIIIKARAQLHSFSAYRVVDYLPYVYIIYLCADYYYKHAWMNMRPGDLATAFFFHFLLLLFCVCVQCRFLLLYPTKAPYFSYGRFYSHSTPNACRCVCASI